ncbi:MAG: carbamoyltransferase [Gammaproteobacteria bacterium]|nr:MAG: carbamoyltransferase [Gammaproteobacteria bacterium]
MWVLGISAFYHDSAAALIHDGDIIAAVQEERFNRKKHYSGFPRSAIKYCLSQAGISLKDVQYIVFYDKPFLKFERLLETYLAFVPIGFRSFVNAMPVWLKEKLYQKNLLVRAFAEIESDFDVRNRLRFTEHHLSHAASAFFPSPFNEAVILTMDGVGEWATTTVMTGHGNKITAKKEIHFPHSLGLLYSAFTYYTGFKVNSGEYKLMGLAPYGKPIYADLIRKHLIDIRDDGSFRLNMKYFSYCTSLTMTNHRFHKLFGRPPRKTEDKITQLDMDLASSVQEITEEVVIRIARNIRNDYGIANLCLAGGVALNCVANGKLLKEQLFDDIWIQPAAGDAGGALGAALAMYYQACDGERKVDSNHDHMSGSYLGPAFSNAEISRQLDKAGARYHLLADEELYAHASQALADNEVVGWFQGRMEYGPRALGCRSILANPASTETQKTVNLKIKYRESFRPFAPSVLEEDVQEYFEMKGDSPYMLVVAPVNPARRIQPTKDESFRTGMELLNVTRSDIPAVTHVDYSARIQTVSSQTNPRYHRLISEFKNRTGFGLVVNTSFNVRGEPIVCTPDDAFACFMGTEMDRLYIGDYELIKSEQDKGLGKSYHESFEPD